MNDIYINNPKLLDKKISEEIFKLVESGKQVKNFKIEKVINSLSINYLSIDDKIIGVGIVKSLNSNYKDIVFNCAKAILEKDKYSNEVGYIVVDKLHTGHRYSEKIIKNILEKYENKNLYATTKNDGMRKIFNSIGFKQVGSNFKNKENEELSLFGINAI